MSSPGSASYPGNPSLPVEVREKILMTFRHALGLFSSGHVSDCLIGCEFILKMDPRFSPAKRLQEKARSRDSDVDISELQALVDSEAARKAPQPSASQPSPAPAPARPGPPTAPVSRAEAPPDAAELLARARERLEAGDFDGTIGLASSALALVPGDREALAMVEKAAGRKAMRPLIESGRERAEEAIAQGRLEEARAELERIRALDSQNPAIGPLERRLASAASSTAGFPETSDFRLDNEEPFGAGAPPADAGADTADASSEPFGLDPFSRPAPLPESGPPEAGSGEPYALEPPSPGEDALVPPPPPAPDLFLPAEPGAVPPFSETPSEDEYGKAAEEIAGLLKKGDETASRGDRQQAIEIWSRVFLIDINNAEAVTRIEKARQEMAEEARLVADLLKSGREAFESGDRDSARKFFHQVQAVDPDEATARGYLERLDERPPESVPAAPAATSSLASGPSSREEVLVPPESLPPPAARRGIALPFNSRVLAVIGAFLALAVVGVYLVLRGGRAQEPSPASAPASLARARDLLGKGKIAEARAELKRIPAGSPDAEEAQRTLAELGKGGPPEGGAKASPAEPPGAASREGRSEADPARLRASAEKALAERRYIEALKNFNLAAPAFRDDPSFAQNQGLAAEKVTALTPAVKFYNEGEYETAIPILWRILQEDRDNSDARSYLLRSYYNQGITQLQNGLYQKAAQAFQEALTLDPNDAEAVRHHKFAERYQKSDLDLMGRIYVRHLNHRP